MNKVIAKDIAIALMAKVSSNIDYFAFKESRISLKETDKILNEINSLCSKMIYKIESKYSIELPNTTHEIVDVIVSE